MRTLALVILALAFFALVPLAQAADYPALKNAYISSHPGQTIIPFPWDISTSVKVLPLNYNIPAAPGNTLSITACRDQFESGSFVITAQKDLAGITIGVPDLTSAQGNRIPADALNVRLVKAWYQADDTNILIDQPGSRFLTPELLLKDDSLVKVDYTNKVNYLRVTINGVQQYIDISSPSARFPSNAQFQDAQTLQPFSLATNENKQVWLTLHVPANTPSGDYSGDLTITTPSGNPVLMNMKVTVLPYELEPSPLEYAIYYRGGVTSAAQPGITADEKTPAQYALELKNMKEHGILYPTLYQNDWALWGNALTLRQQAGLPNDHIYVVEWQTGNPTDAAGLAALQKGIATVKNLNAPFGYKDTYIYGMDEAKGDVLRSERTAWQTTHTSGAKVFAACYDDAVDISGDLLDVAVLDESLDPAQAAAWHSYGKRVFSYDNPQVGVENPELYRKNFGFALWNAGFDGAMDYAYQHDFGFMWNDFDDPVLRDHVFSYQTSNGLIDTVQWEGWREGVDDTRYLASALKQGVSASSVRSTVSGSLSRGESMGTLRQKLISQIPGSPVTTPTPSPTQTPTQSPTPVPTPTVTPTPSPLGSITVTSPNGGETAAAGSPYRITWASSGSVGSMVKLELLKAGAVVQTMSDENDGAYNSWVIPSGTVAGTDYRIRITSATNAAITDTGDGTFSITSTSGTPAGSLAVTSPNGGESWVSGSTHAITWTSSGSVGSTVKIEVLKAGVVVQTISEANDSSYPGWVIPSGTAAGTDYRIRITSATNAAITDTSNANFAITSATPAPSPAGSITVTSPNGGESWVSGSTHAITWSSSGSAGSNVKVELLKAGVVVQTMSDANDGSYSGWVIPSGTAAGTDYRIRITSATNATITGTSNANFSITSGTAAGSITVTSPNGGETAAAVSPYRITWSSSGSAGSNVKIELLKAGVVVQTMNDANDGAYNSWVIPPGTAAGTDYRIRITSSTNTVITDTSNGNFSITSGTAAGSITVTSPNGGETAAAGSPYRITWSSSGSAGSNVKIELLKAGVVVQTMNDANDGAYNSWVIPPGTAAGTDYRIRITSSTNAAITDTSNGNFSITSTSISGTPAGSITVTSPNGGETGKAGSQYRITWTSSGSVGSMVKLELLKAGVVVQTMSDENDGAYNSWVIPSGTAAGTDYRIRITSTTNAAITDTSNSNFSITS